MPILILWRKTEEELASGAGLVAMSATAAAVKLGVSAARLRQLVMAGALVPVERFAKANLFLADDIEKLRLSRAANI
jgi:hypothetical protein